MERYGRHYIFQNKWLALILACVMSFSSVFQVAVSAMDITSSELKIQSGNQEFLDGTEVETNKIMSVNFSGSFSGEREENTRYEARLYIGDMKTETFDNITGGGKVIGAEYIADGIKYTVKQDANTGKKYIHIEKYDTVNNKTVDWEDGDTFKASLNVHFDASAENGAEWPFTLKFVKVTTTSDGTKTEKEMTDANKSISVKAKSEAQINNTKSADVQSLTLGAVSGQTTLGRDIKYTVSAYSGSELDTKNRRFGIGEAPIRSYTVTDTLSFREFEGNVYIPAGDNAEQAIRNALTAPAGVNYSITNIEQNDEKITGFTFTYTVDNDKYNSADGTCTEQIQDTQYVFTLKGSSVTVADGFTDTNANKKITNSVSTTAQTIHNVSVTAHTDSADTTVRRPKYASYAGANKSVADVSDQYGTWNSWDSNAYVVEGDYVLYKIEFKNSGETPITGATITDTLPDGLTAAEDITGDNYQNVQNKFNDQGLYDNLIKLNNANNYNGPWVTSGTASASASGQTVKFNNVSVNAGRTFEAYILAKVTGSVEVKTTKTNSVTINNEAYTASINQQPKKANVSVSKSVVNTTDGSNAQGNATYNSNADETVRYTITVSNNGTADAEGVTLKDIFPSDWIDITNISNTNPITDDDSSTEPEEDKKTTTTYTWDNLKVPAGESVTVTIEGKIKDGVKDDTIINTAQTVYDGETKEANAELTRIDPAQYVEVNKSTESTSANPGGEIEYTINVDTKGAEFDASQPLKIVDEIPNGLEYVSSKVTEEGGLTRYTEQGSDTEVSGNYVRWSFIGNGTAVIKVKFKVKDNFIGSISNTAYAVGGNGSTGTSTAGKVEVVRNDALTVTKTAAVNGTTINSGDAATINAGDTLSFNITITNNNNYDITEFTLYDSLIGKYDPNGQNGTIDLDVSQVGYTNNNHTWPNNDTRITNMNDGSYKDRWDWDAQAGSTIHTFDCTGTASGFIFTNNESNVNSRKNVFYNPDFKLGAGQSITVTYSIKTSEYMTGTGSNEAWANDGEHSKVSYTIGTVSPTTAPGESPAPENQSKLTIEKTVSDKYDGSNPVDEIIIQDSNNVRSKEFFYTVTVKNDSDTAYTASDAAIVDFLPEGWGLKAQGDNGNVWSNTGTQIKSVKLAYKYSTSEDGWITRAEAWEQYKNYNAYPENVLAIYLTDTDTPLTIPAHGFISVTYAVKAKAEEVSKIQSEINSNSSTFDFTPRTLTNTAYFTGDTSFINIDGSSVKTIFDNATVKVRAQSVHPGITKTAYAFFPAANEIQEGKNGAMPGDCLIWKIKIENAGDSTNGRAMSNYIVTDTLPNGYQYVTDQTYTNSNGTKYPDNLSNEFQRGKMIKRTADGTTVELDYLAPTEVSKTVTWNFNDSKYTLEPGEYLEFLVITKPETKEYKSGVYYNNAKLTVEGNLYEDTISAGVAGGGGVTDGDSFSINSVVTSSQMSVKGTNGTAVGGTETNSVSGIGGETVTYTMQVKNESSNKGITNLTIINRLPYEGDSGVLTSGARNSEFEVTYKDALSVYYIDGSGNRTDLSEENYVVTTYSSDEEKTFTEESSDWTSAATEDGWKTGYDDSTKLVRIQFNKFTLPAGATVYAEYSAQLPYASSEMDMTAWNSFAYRYDEEGKATGRATNMAGEPAAVGVRLSQTDTQMGSIRVKKAWVSSSTEEKTFYFAVYDNAYADGGQLVGEVKQVTLSAGGGTARPVSAEITFDNLPYVAIGREKTYYIYETDKNGVPIKQDESLGYNMYLGYYRSSDKVTWTEGNVGSDGNILVTGTDKSDSSKKYEMTKIAEGNYSHWTKGLSATKQSNTAQFSNIDMNPEPTQEPVQETTVDIMGPYYADVPVSAETNSQLDTGKKVGDSHVEQDGIDYTYINGERVTGLSQYGGEQGHTIATGFMAKITAGTGGETINSISWEITSSKIIEETDPSASSEPDGVYVKLPVYTASPETIEEIGADESESYEVIYVNDFPADIFVDEAFDQEVSLGAEDEIEDLGGDPNYMDETERIDAVAQNLGFDPDSVLYDENGQAFFIINQDIELYANDGKGKDGTLNAGALPEGDYQNFINNGVHMLSKYKDTADGKYYAIFKLVRSGTKNNQLKWTINESLETQITLEAGASIHFGIILDELYDRNATAQFKYNEEGITTSDDFKKEREKITENTDQVKVPGHNEFKK